MPKELNTTKVELLQPRSETSPNVPGKIQPDTKRIMETEDVIVTDEHSPAPSFLEKAAKLGCILNPDAAAFEAMNAIEWESKHRVTVYDAKSGLPNYELAYKGDKRPKIGTINIWDYRTTPDIDEKIAPIVGLKKTTITVTDKKFLEVTNLSAIRTIDTPLTIHTQPSGAIDFRVRDGKIQDTPDVRKIVGDVIDQLSKIPELQALRKTKKRYNA